MNHDYVEDHQVVDRYLLGRLTAEETDRFEEHYLSCQDCIDQLELGEKFQRAFKYEAAREVARVAVAGRLGLAAWLARLARSGRLAGVVAALFVLGSATALLYEHNLRRGLEDRLAEAREPQARTLLLRLGPERGPDLGSAEPTYQVHLPSSPAWIVLELELELRDPGPYRFILNRGGEEIWRSDPLRPQPLRSVSLHSDWLEPGVYILRVSRSVSAAEEIETARFSFRALAAE